MVPPSVPQPLTARYANDNGQANTETRKGKSRWGSRKMVFEHSVGMGGHATMRFVPASRACAVRLG
jgi:hypothetical protein